MFELESILSDLLSGDEVRTLGRISEVLTRRGHFPDVVSYLAQARRFLEQGNRLRAVESLAIANWFSQHGGRWKIVPADLEDRVGV